MCKYFRFYCQEPTKDYLRGKKGKKSYIFHHIRPVCKPGRYLKNPKLTASKRGTFIEQSSGARGQLESCNHGRTPLHSAKRTWVSSLNFPANNK